jgi:hypothetical protein
MTTQNRKIYRGWVAGGHGPRVTVYDGEHVEPLNHIVRHSPDGFSWGYHGSGPAELAHCILVDHTGAEVEPAVYQQFKAEVIAKLAMDDDWMITAEYIDEWLEAIGLPITEADVLDEEVEQMKVTVRCECCDYSDAAERMTRDESGAWLCWPCSKGEGRE